MKAIRIGNLILTIQLRCFIISSFFPLHEQSITMGIENLPAFFAAAIILIMSPGIDTIYIISRSISEGRLAGIISALGICCGLVVHTSMAAFGLSALIATSAVLFAIIKYAGAAYLIYLGVQALITNNSIDLDKATRTDGMGSKWAVFKKGMVTNILNPKVALFFFSFLPQFVQPGYTDPILPFFLLGGLFFILSVIWCSALAVAASWISSSIRQNDRIQNWLQKASGLVFIGLGIKIVLEKE